ncbi:hypothetical protein ZWY2020_051849 [Hordeum vulgare]|nr:hypothetical protein ZWY2020_051849 [Hordeum vulgare]
MGEQSKRTRAPVPRLVPVVLPHLVQKTRPPRPPRQADATTRARIRGSILHDHQRQRLIIRAPDASPLVYCLDRGVDSYPPGGFLGFFKDASNVNSSQQIKEKDDSNGVECARTEKGLLWTKDEDLRLVGAWLNNSNDPIQSNYKKNEQYWKDVAAVYNMKQVKDRFGRIKKKVAWFCASWKEANALYASGESDTDLKKRAMQTYEADHKEDGPFMFEHFGKDVEPDKRKFSVDDEVGQHFTLDDDKEQRPPGGKTTKDQRKRKTKDEGCIIDLEDELSSQLLNFNAI